MTNHWEPVPQTDKMLDLGLKVVGKIVQLTRKSLGRHGADRGESV